MIALTRVLRLSSSGKALSGHAVHHLGLLRGQNERTNALRTALVERRLTEILIITEG